MKTLNKGLLTFVAILSFFYANAQDANVLKEFINENSIALKSVQKYSIKLGDEASSNLVKDLLKWQVIAVKLYSTDKAASTAAALKVRTESSDFLSKNASGSIEYLKITDEETKQLVSSTSTESAKNYLSDKEIKSINKIDTKNPSFFNQFSISIQ